MSGSRSRQQASSGMSAAPEGSDAWVPDAPGAQLHGEVTDVDLAWSDWRGRQAPNDPNAGWYPLLTIKQDDGSEVKLHGFRTVLFNELAKRQPIPGERVTITYVGEGEAKDGMNAPHIFRVTVHGRPPEAAKGLYASLTGGRQLPPTPGPGAPITEPPVAPDDGSDHPLG